MKNMLWVLFLMAAPAAAQEYRCIPPRFAADFLGANQDMRYTNDRLRIRGAALEALMAQELQVMARQDYARYHRWPLVRTAPPQSLVPTTPAARFRPITPQP
jgi:hypothetical protein